LVNRTITLLVGAAIALVMAAPAHATLIYNKNPSGGKPPRVYVANNNGTHPHRIGKGRAPLISPDGRWVAWIAPGSPERVLMRLADRSRKPRTVAKSSAVGDLHFSPDSKSLGIVLGTRLWVYNIHDRESVKAASGHIRGFAFAPDSGSVAFGTAGRNDAFGAPADLYSFDVAHKTRARITRDRKSLNPLWGPDGIIHDRQTTRQNDSPSYNLFEIQPDGGSLRRITSLRSVPLVSGLVPLELSANGKRLLAELEGQDTSAGFAVNPSNGKVRLLGKGLENGFVGANLTADGRTVLGQTGGADPNNRHNIGTMPYRGGKAKVLVRHATDPDWSA
jgi:Tol biopolymer transport system component